MVRERPAIRFLTDGDEPADVMIDLLTIHGDAPALHRMIESTRIDHIPVELLVLAGSPRSSGEDPQHIRQLLEAAGSLPPIVVHRPTMRVVDGFHRVQVARQLDMPEIAAHLFDGDAESAFLLGITLNVAHGLPLTRADRNSAADQLLHDHPEWSNRMIGSVVGLSDKTIAARRTKLTAENPQLTRRIGRDGRSRPSTSRQRPQPTTEPLPETDRPLHATEDTLQERGRQREERGPRNGRVTNVPPRSSTRTRVGSSRNLPPTDLMIERLKDDPSFVRPKQAGQSYACSLCRSARLRSTKA
jgi:ParB-like chromosome segregation protein Spo0J